MAIDIVVKFSLTTFAAKKCLPVKFLEQLGVSDNPSGIAIAYRLQDGTLATKQRIRIGLSAKDGFRWVSVSEPILKPEGACSASSNRLDPSQHSLAKPQKNEIKQEIVPYGLWRLQNHAKKYIIIVEGESDCWSIWFHCLPAMGLPGATTAKLLKPAYLVGLENIYIWQEPDTAGGEFVNGVAKQIHDIGLKIKLWAISIKGVKDPSDLHIDNAKTFVRDMRYAMALGRPVKYVPPASKPRPENRQSKSGELDADKIRRASDYPLANLVETNNGKILCPFHKDTNPSMIVNHKYPFGKCFVCGKTMNGITYLMKFEGMKFSAAINYLCGKMI